jgi:hypothetical protein
MAHSTRRACGVWRGMMRTTPAAGEARSIKTQWVFETKNSITYLVVVVVRKYEQNGE